IKLYIFAIIIFIIVIIFGVIIIIKVNQTFFSPYIQIFISLILIIMALYSMINTYIASILLAIVFIGLVIWAFTNDST
ncbi:hypothetical protein DOS67_08775, partial [Staphylococcus felis]